MHGYADRQAVARRTAILAESAVRSANQVHGTTPVFRKDDRTASYCVLQTERVYFHVPFPCEPHIFAFAPVMRIKRLLRDALDAAADPLSSYLEDLDNDHFEQLIDAFRPHEVPMDAYVIVQGHYVENDKPGLFVLEDGMLEALKADKYEERVVQRYTEPGSIFGELAAPRAATVVARTDAVIWSVSRQTVRKITCSFQEAKRKYYDRKLMSVDVLQPLDDEERQQVIEPGDYFGELALMHASPRAATVTATDFCTLAVLAEKDFRRLLGPLASFHEEESRRPSRLSHASSPRQSFDVAGRPHRLAFMKYVEHPACLKLLPHLGNHMMDQVDHLACLMLPQRANPLTGQVNPDEFLTAAAPSQDAEKAAWSTPHSATRIRQPDRQECSQLRLFVAAGIKVSRSAFLFAASSHGPGLEKFGGSFCEQPAPAIRAANGIVGRSPQKIVNLGVTLASNASKYVSFTKVVGKKD
eukprot:s2299_g9.t3